MAAEICSRFGGYPSDYLRDHKLGQLFLDYNIFLALIDAEKKALNNRGSNNG